MGKRNQRPGGLATPVKNRGHFWHAESLGSTSTINQEAWAFGSAGDLEQGTTRNIPRAVPDTPAPKSELTWPDGRPIDLAVMNPEFSFVVR